MFPVAPWPGRQCLHLGLLTAVMLCVQLFPSAGFAEGESLEVRQNLLKERVVTALKTGDTLGLYAAMDDYRLLEKEGAIVPPGLFFSEAEAARSRNDPVRATRAFDDYFRVAAPEGDVFSEALRVYGEFKSGIPAGIWNLLEGMLPVAGGSASAGPTPQGAASRPSVGGDTVVEPFSLGSREVTRSQFHEFVTATGYRPRGTGSTVAGACNLEADDWTQPGFDQADDHPVVCVSWDDAIAYVSWLSQWSGLKFRLPTAAEWEHAARAGTSTAYWYGDVFDPDMGNGKGAAGRDQWEQGTAPVARFPPSPFGLHDMLGNVSEWVDDCAEPDREAPSGCRARVIRGGNWTSDPAGLTWSAHSQQDSSFRSPDIGFRLAIGH